jgi:CP family cyanate transporter-like MFS transporter
MRRRGGTSAVRSGARSGAVAALPATPNALPPVWRRPLVWLLVLAFTAHLFIYYGLTAWLPAFLIQADGMAATKAGFVASVFQVMALLGAFGVPLLAGRVSGAALLVGIALAWLVTCTGFLALPGQWLLWSITGGIATGGGFTTVFTLAMGYAHDLNDNRRISSVVQGLGYAIASVGPLLIGALHQAGGGWRLSFSLLASSAALIALAGIGVARAGPKTRTYGPG